MWEIVIRSVASRFLSIFSKIIKISWDLHGQTRTDVKSSEKRLFIIIIIRTALDIKYNL